MPSKDWPGLAHTLKDALGLATPPLSITFSADAPSGVPPYDAPTPPPTEDGRTGKVTAGCVFWMKGVEQAFTTAPEDHFNCSVGSVTHGLKTLDEVMDKEDVRCLVGSEWVSVDEVKQLPVVQDRASYITYAPLSETPVDPDVVLLRINAFQSMVINDTFPDVVLVGKPQCHHIAISKEDNKLVISTGCILSRVRTGMLPHEMTCTIPGRRLEEVVSKLTARRETNAQVSSYANRDGRRFA